MTQRKPIVGGNWKMNGNGALVRSLAHEVVVGGRSLVGGCEIALFPPFVYLEAVGGVIDGEQVILGAQNVYHDQDGAFTGEISVAMLRDLGVGIVLVGHSERRHVIGEDDALVSRKLRAAVAGGLGAVLCIGETQQQRDAGETEQVNVRQLDSALEGINAHQLERIVIAYEPVWAIGTGRTATPDDAQQVHSFIRTRLAEMYDNVAANAMRIQYGGSVKAHNAAELAAQPDIDGFLVGGASLKAEEFLQIVAAAGANR